MTIKVRRLSDALGVEILGVNPAEPIRADIMREIRQLWLDNNIFFHIR